VIKNNKAYIQVGAGIVADSIPEKEYQETLHKAQAMLTALAVT
jgi:anthranilate/para-aminobenzoate synthase component I